VAGLGKVISDHGGGLDPAGTTEGPIFGPRLDGRPGLAEIIDTDNGRLDGDTGYDRAVGPMQIIPLGWSGVGADSDGDGKASPRSIYDSALAAGRYLCDDEAELDGAPAQAQALFRYQRSESFVRAALGWSRAYAIRQAQPQLTLSLLRCRCSLLRRCRSVTAGSASAGPAAAGCPAGTGALGVTTGCFARRRATGASGSAFQPSACDRWIAPTAPTSSFDDDHTATDDDHIAATAGDNDTATDDSIESSAAPHHDTDGSPTSESTTAPRTLTSET